MKISFESPESTARETIKQIVFSGKNDDNLLLLHHCKVTMKSIRFMQEIQKVHPNVEIAMVTAPYNGMEGKFSEEYEALLRSLNMQYINNVWSFLPENAYRRAQADPSDHEVSFLPPPASRPSTYGIYLLLEYYSTIRELERLGVDQMSKMMDLLLKAAAPMHGFTPDEFHQVALDMQNGNGQAVDDFLKKRADYLQQHPMHKISLDRAVKSLTNMLQEMFPSTRQSKEEVDKKNPFSTIKSAIFNGGEVVHSFKDDLSKLEGIKSLPSYKLHGGKWEKQSMEISKVAWKVPRALTKAIEALYAPMENLALDGTSALKKIKELSPSIENLFDRYAVIELHDMEFDDIGAVNGFKQLNPPPGRHITAIQMSTSDKKGDFNLRDLPHFLDFLNEYCAATHQQGLYVFVDDESWNKNAVKETVEIFYPHQSSLDIHETPRKGRADATQLLRDTTTLALIPNEVVV